MTKEHTLHHFISLNCLLEFILRPRATFVNVVSSFGKKVWIVLLLDRVIFL